MTDQEIAKWKKEIDSMDREHMCRLWRFAEPGYPCFDLTTPLAAYFKERFDKLGGFSPEISKALGWKKP